jgi:hypothetical protein
MSDGDQSKQFFLLDQQIVWLKEGVPFGQRRYHVCGDERPTEKIVDNPWEPVRRFTDEKDPNKVGIVELARSEEWRRVALVCDAGLGKTANLRWLQRHLCEPESRVLPLLIPLDEPAGRILLQKERDSGDILVRRLARQIMDAAKGKLKTHVRAVERLRSAGRIVLLIDGLDHAIANPETATMLKELIDSAEWRGCPLWIAGRPYAFAAAWPTLFNTDDWKFLRVGGLQRPEIRFYLARQAGADVYSRIPDESAQLFAVPRLLKLISRIIKRELPAGANEATQIEALQRLNLARAADVYHLAYFHPGQYDDINSRGLLGQGLAGKGKRIGLKKGQKPDALNYETRLRRTAQILGAIAFEMYTMHTNPERPQPNFEGVAARQLEGFEIAVADRLLKAGLDKQSDFNRDFNHLTKMNINTVEYLVFRQSDKHGLAWRDRTVHAFFAAYWAMNYAVAKELNAMDRWKFVLTKEGKRLAGFGEFWQFAAEMPDRALQKGDKLTDEDLRRWKHVFHPCYTPPAQVTGPHEWVQWHRRMMYHSFGLMQVRSPHAVAAWRVKTPEQEAIVAEIEAGWCDIAAGICHYGAEPSANRVGRVIQVAAFRMHQWPVVNRWFEAFDPAHRARRWCDARHVLAGVAGRFGEDYCPAVNVTWYDSWCFAAWIGDHVALPSEVHWEHACRKFTALDYYFQGGEEELLKRAWFTSPLKNAS